jgi:hypothetical protein
MGSAAHVAADDVHLDNGEVIEGKVTRTGDKVVIELESGRISLSADSVKRVEKRESGIEHFEKSYEALRNEDVAKRMQLADYCRDHGMRDRERQLLSEVIAREPNHEQARQRLGFVKGANGAWLTYGENMRARGNVLRDGQWLTPEQAQEHDRLEVAARTRVTADAEAESRKLEVERQKLELERARVELERAREQREAAGAPPVFIGGYGYGYVAPRSHAHGTAVGGYSRGSRGYDGATRSFPINGVRDPRDNTWSIPGTRNPRDSLP